MTPFEYNIRNDSIFAFVLATVVASVLMLLALGITIIIRAVQ